MSYCPPGLVFIASNAVMCKPVTNPASSKLVPDKKKKKRNECPRAIVWVRRYMLLDEQLNYLHNALNRGGWVDRLDGWMVDD